MCHLDPFKRLILALVIPGTMFAQTDWRRIGGSTFDAGLASLATGPISSVWFSADGGKLNVKTSTGAVWESSDFNSWTPVSAPDARPKQLAAPAVLHTPEVSMRTVVASSGVIYGLGLDLFRSEDSGRTWANLTGYNGRSVIGPGQNDVAVNPRDPRTILVANAWGLWASHDSGLSWTGLNDNLPNLRLTEIHSAGRTITASLATLGDMQWSPGQAAWEMGTSQDDGRGALSAKLKAPIRALSGSGDTWYAGSVDGYLWTSRDGKTNWTLSPTQAGGPIERIFQDPDQPSIAFAVASGKSKSILRTINGGQFWDDITGSLTENPAHGIAADRSSGSIYVATDRGVFLARADLNALGPVSPWTALTGLPGNPALDVKTFGIHLYVSVDGYGLYVRSTPQLTGALRIVSSADQTDRPAAPGSLLSVVGRRVQSASAGPLSIPILASSAEESQIQVPFEATGSQLNLTLDRFTTSIALKSVSPAIFLDREGSPMLLDADTGVVLESRSSLRPRSRIQVLATGLGRTSPVWLTAVPAPAENPPVVAAVVQAFLNGMPISVTRATLAPGYVGLYLIELELPGLLDAGAAEFYLSADGQESNRVRVFIQSDN